MQHFPAPYAFVAACCITPPALSYLHSDEVCFIQSAEGVQQEDPIGPFLFTLALQPFFQSVFPGVSGSGDEVSRRCCQRKARKTSRLCIFENPAEINESIRLPYSSR